MAASIDPAQPIPLYFQLKTLLLEQILEGRYDGDGGKLPTEHELCEQFAISRTPVTRALSELAEEGVILRHRRRGTFVNPHWMRRPVDRRELRVVVSEGPWGTMIRDAAAGRFQLNLLTVPRPSLHQVLTRAVAEGNAPDLAIVDSVWIPEFAAAGFLRPIDGIDPAWVREEHGPDFLPPLLAANRFNGQTFGVSAFADVSGMWYRRRVLDKAGVEPPRTWNELRAVSRVLAAAGVRKPLVLPGGSQGEETTAYCLIAFLASNGARVLADGEVALASRSAVQALRFLRSLVEEGLIPAEVVKYAWDRPTSMLAEGQTGISFGGSYAAAGIAETLGVPLEELWEHVGFLPMPAGPQGAPATAAGTMAYGIFTQSAQPKAALELLELAVDPRALAGIARATGRVPARRSAVRLAEVGLPFLSETAELLERAVIRPATPDYPRVSAQLQAMLERVLTGSLTPAAAVAHTAELIAAITGLPVASAGGRRAPRRPDPAPA
jgi:ABC-type glycerol-3-phosphate transport system substrate-binding protein/DNA-binding transcriptional regulator YhcF (GntR family)